MAEEKEFQLQVVTPDRIFYDGPAEMLELTTTEGDIGILKGHIPLTSMIAPGIMKIKTGTEEKEAAIHDGFMEILKNKVLILSESCEWPEDIDINRANEAKIRAERRLKSTDSTINLTRAETALRRSLIRIQLAERYK